MTITGLFTLDYASRNILREVYYQDEQRLIGFTDSPIDPEQPMQPGAGMVPDQWAYADQALVTELMEGYERVRIFATRTAPFARFEVTDTTPDPGAGTSDIQILNLAVTGTTLSFEVATSRPPFATSLSSDDASLQPGVVSYANLPTGQSGTLYARDAGGFRTTADYYVADTGGGPGSGPAPRGGVKVDEFTVQGLLKEIYYDATPPRKVRVYSTPATGQPATVTVAERGRADGEEITRYTEAGQTIIVEATLTTPFARAYGPGPGPVPGCTDPTAENYNPAATLDDGSCAFAPEPDPVIGCLDELASNFNPLATQANNSLCVYAPAWRALWGPDGVRVAVPPPEPEAAYVLAQLYAGYPEGHPDYAVRPERFVADVRAVASPRTGLAEFSLAPYLRPQAGALQGDDTRRLDLNSPTAHGSDLLVGYRLLVGTRTVARGYALNSALSQSALDALVAQGRPLSAFGVRVPLWPGYDYPLSVPGADASGRFGQLQQLVAGAAGALAGLQPVIMPCPRQGVPVAWLAPAGGFGYWVFAGFHLLGDSVAEGQEYTEAGTGEIRLSRRDGSRRTMEAYSGAFAHRELAEGLRTLRRAVQAWYQPDGPGTEWVPIVLKGGTFPAYRLGRNRYEASFQFTESAAVPVQGQ